MRVTSALMIALTLSACGGVDGGSGTIVGSTPTPTPSPVPSPTPSPLPSPTPTPTPSPVSTAFPLVAPQRFETAYAAIQYGNQFLFSDATLFPINGASSITFPFPLTDTFRPNIIVETVNTGNLTTQGGQRIAAFNRGSAPISTARYYSAFVSTQPQTLDVYNTVYPDAVVADPVYQFRYVNFARWTDQASNWVSLSIYGFLTPVAVVPLAGTRTYAASVESTALSAVPNSLPSPFPYPNSQRLTTVTVDFSARTVRFDVQLQVINSDGTVATTPQAFAATGRLNADGTVTGTIVGGVYTGEFTGNLFGPAGAEIGLVISVRGQIGERQIRIAASLVGK